MSFKLCAFADEASSELGGQISALNENGIPYIELRGVGGKNISTLLPYEVKEIRSALDGGNIAVWSIGSPIGKSDIHADFSVEFDRFRRVLDSAHILGAECMRIFSFYKTGGREEYFDEVCMRLDRFAEAARGSGVVLCHENEKGIFGDSAERCFKLHSAIPELFAVFDPANFVQCNEDTLIAFDLLSPFVHYAHIKDAVRSGAVVPPGHGDGNLPALISRFKASGLEVLTLEPHLHDFVGLSGLEDDQKSAVGGTLKFKDQRDAFDFAVNALKKLICEV